MRHKVGDRFMCMSDMMTVAGRKKLRKGDVVTVSRVLKTVEAYQLVGFDGYVFGLNKFHWQKLSDVNISDKQYEKLYE